MKISFTKILFVLLILSYNSYAQDTTITALNNVHQGNGAGLATRSVIDTFLLPHDLSGYNQINMHVLLSCPAGGCDPWDRFANISIYNNNDWFEIGRYITPYGRSCGWVIDVSDYRSMLHDTVIMNSFIDTWTNPGWLVKIDFQFVAGVPLNPDIKVENLWVNYGVIYGDTTQPINIPIITKTIDPAATTVKLKIVNTGHGQGNTDNAAEFSQKIHHIYLNNALAFSQTLWRSNCGSNPCSPQSGTWQYNRAGWCPGADVIPNVYNITSTATPGQPIDIEYRLQSYFNTCSPHNPSCVTTGACPDCNYNYNGHTEPHYKISGQLITYINGVTGISNPSEKFSYSIVPNPSEGIFKLNINGGNETYRVEVFNIIGNSLLSMNAVNGTQLVNLSTFPKGLFFLKLEGREINKVEKLVVE
jgi:hypothetical protein